MPRAPAPGPARQPFLLDQDAALVLVMPHLAEHLGQLFIGLWPEILVPAFGGLAGKPVETPPAPTTLPSKAP